MSLFNMISCIHRAQHLVENSFCGLQYDIMNSEACGCLLKSMDGKLNQELHYEYVKASFGGFQNMFTNMSCCSLHVYQWEILQRKELFLCAVVCIVVFSRLPNQLEMTKGKA